MWSVTLVVPAGHWVARVVLLYEEEGRARRAVAEFREAVAKMDDPDGPAGVTLVLGDDFGTEVDVPAASLDETVVVLRNEAAGAARQVCVERKVPV